MKKGYQIFVKRSGENNYSDCGILNWFMTHEEAIKRVKELEKTWRKFGREYIIVKL